MAEILEPTIFQFPGFNPLDDVKALRASMKGFGTDEDAIIQILTKRSSFQRHSLIDAFKKEFGRDLIKDLKSELGGKFEDLVLALMETNYEYLAKELHRAMAQMGTEEDILTEILCTRSNDDIQRIIESYQNLYGKSLESEIISEVSGDYKRLLVLLLSLVRAERTVYPERAKEMAEILYSAGEGKMGTDEEAFVTILTHQSFPQLKLIFDEYQKISGKTFEQAVNSELSGDLKEAVMTIVKCSINRPRYFAEKIQKAMKGMGTDDATLIRIIVSRSEIDLGAIRREYQTMHHRTLSSAISSETGGDYKKALIALVCE